MPRRAVYTAPGMTPHELEANLASFLAQRLGAPVQVRHLERNTEGFSQETFSFDAELRGETRGYVAKREPPAGLLEPYDLEPEFRVLHGLSGQGVLSPPTPWFSDDPQVLERPFYVMERLPGEVPLPTAGASGRPGATKGLRKIKIESACASGVSAMMRAASRRCSSQQRTWSSCSTKE